MHPIVGAVVAAALSLLLAFFFVFRTLFADGPSDLLHPEYLLAHALNVVGYGLLVMLLVRFAGPSPWWTAVAVPGVVITLAYMDPGLGLRMLTLAGVLAGTAIGWWAGSAWHSRATR